MSYNHVSLTEQLKEVVKAQNESLRYKENELKKLRAENTRLQARVRELEAENNELKGGHNKHRLKSAMSPNKKAQNGDVILKASILDDSVQSPDSSRSEFYTTALTSPGSPNKTSTGTLDANQQITITLSSTPNSISKFFPSIRSQVSPKKTLSRSESRKAKRSSFYELSPDISDKHVQLLENCYGGKKKANHAARVIQQHYRSWAMKRAYFRLRTQSEARRLSIKGQRGKRGSVRSPSSSEELSPILTMPVPLNLSLDTSSQSVLAIDGKSPASPRTKTSEAETPSKDEFKAIQTDLDIDENFQPVEVLDTGQGGVSVRRMSEDISSIEISKNLLNNSIGQQIIIDEVFQQILSPSRKDSVSLGGRSDSFRSRRGEKAPVAIVESTQELESTPECEVVPDKEGVQKHEVEKESVNVKEEQEEKNDVVKESGEEKPMDKGMMDSNENFGTIGQMVNGKFLGSTESFEVADGHSYSWPTLDQLVGDDTTSMSGNSLSPSSSIIQTFYEDKEKDLRIGVNHFNRKPKIGINYLIDTGLLENDPECVCKFLREEPGINKQRVGEFLGDLRNPFSMVVLQSFVRSINLDGKEVDEALRFFQTFFRMPGEAQKIERLVEEFSAAYVESNPGRISDNPDTILVLSFAIIMLNTDLHSPNVKRKMSKEEFTRNLRGTDNGEDLPSQTLSDIYDRVQKRPFKTGPDNLDAVMKYEKQILGKVPWTSLALPHRQLRQVTSLYEVIGGKRKEKPHHRVVFLFNDMLVVTKERGQAGQKGIHYYSYKSSYSLCDVKFSLFNNNCEHPPKYKPHMIGQNVIGEILHAKVVVRPGANRRSFLDFKYGIRLLNRSDSKVLISFHAKKEDIRKAFHTELRDCIEETSIMESVRINSEKTRQLSVMRFNKRDLEETMSLTLPRSNSQNKKKAPDSLSLMNEPSTLSESDLTSNKLLSSSLQDLTQGDGTYFEEPSLHKSSSVTTFDYMGSVSTENISWHHYQNSSQRASDLFMNGSSQTLPKFGLFGSKRIKNRTQRKLAKSAGSLEDIKAMQRSGPKPKRKSEFFVKSPIAT